MRRWRPRVGMLGAGEKVEISLDPPVPAGIQPAVFSNDIRLTHFDGKVLRLENPSERVSAYVVVFAPAKELSLLQLSWRSISERILATLRFHKGT